MERNKIDSLLVVNVGRALVKLDPDEDKTESGLFLPGEQTGPRKGTVMAAGAARVVDGVHTSLALEPGQRVIVDPLGATKLKVEGVELILVRLEDVVARIRQVG